ncbi:hypothetical protein ACFOWZ_34335 [Lentzea rhizosphaerae]|uniref:Uncharacterized protein n=1 Tax=Lentzea rhizosphaerae TaxID=2041025 RepID=A0ABV8C3G4_9PSEU
MTKTDPDAREKLHIAKVLLGGYAAAGVLTLPAIVVFSGNPDIVTGAVSSSVEVRDDGLGGPAGPGPVWTVCGPSS